MVVVVVSVSILYSVIEIFCLVSSSSFLLISSVRNYAADDAAINAKLKKMNLFNRHVK